MLSMIQVLRRTVMMLMRSLFLMIVTVMVFDLHMAGV